MVGEDTWRKCTPITIFWNFSLRHTLERQNNFFSKWLKQLAQVDTSPQQVGDTMGALDVNETWQKPLDIPSILNFDFTQRLTSI